MGEIAFSSAIESSNRDNAFLNDSTPIESLTNLIAYSAENSIEKSLRKKNAEKISSYSKQTNFNCGCGKVF